jgi:hypothetical protein
MTYGIHTLMKAVKPSTGNRLFDRRVRIAEPPKLPNRDDTMLSTSQIRQSLSPRQRFSIHKREKLYRARSLPLGDGKR